MIVSSVRCVVLGNSEHDAEGLSEYQVQRWWSIDVAEGGLGALCVCVCEIINLIVYQSMTGGLCMRLVLYYVAWGQECSQNFGSGGAGLTVCNKFAGI